MNIIEVQQLVKRYGSFTAVNDISFDIPQGICFGILGPNGAGKTTTIEIMEGITPNTSGEVLYQGQAIGSNFSQIAGIQFQQTALPDYLTTFEVLKMFSRFYRSHIELDTLVELCDLGDFLNTYATQLSGGQRQRLLLALALINDPKIVFLDEPTTGLDPHSRRKFWQLIDNIKKQGKTIVLTTHYMEEAEFLCDQLIIMDKGKIIARGTPNQLLSEHFNSSSISLDKNNDISKQVLQDIQLENTQVEWREEKCLIFTNNIEQTLSQLLKNNIPLHSMRIYQPTLEDLFLKLTGNALQ